jgi:hypothetical protein
LQFDFAGLSDVVIELDYVAKRADELGEDISRMWLGLVRRARQARK